MNCALPKGNLGIDQALLNISVNTGYGVTLWSQQSECDKCSLTLQKTLKSLSNGTLQVNTSYPTIIEIVETINNKLVCREQYHFGEHGRYLMNITNTSRPCDIEVLVPPVNSNLHLLWATLFFLGLSILWNIGVFLYRRKFRNTPEDERLLVSDLGSPSERGSGSQIWSFSVEPNINRLRERLRSLDTFRGICIVIMIFVNYGGGRYWFFQHSKWNGLTVADLVFPWFMWIMGTSIALSLQSQLRRAIPKKLILLKIIRRSIVLGGLGLILDSKYGLGCDLSEMRLLGVLQRFGVAYFTVASLQLLSEKPGDVYQFERWAFMRDILPYWPQWILMFLVIAAHTLITFMLPVPGCPTGYLGPGGLHLNSSYPNCTGGAAGYIDRFFLGEHHIYRTPSCMVLYETSVPFDPEGILGYLTTTIVVFLGLQAGKILTMYPVYLDRVKRWIIWAVITGGIGALLCKASQNDGWIPINKNLWSLSYVMATSSMSFFLLLLCYVLVDVLSWWSGCPFHYAGMNAILLYVGHELTAHMFPWYIPVPETHLAQLCIDLWGTALWVLIAVWLHHSKFFLAV